MFLRLHLCVEALTGLLEGPRASGAFKRRIILDPPWSIKVQDGSPLCLTAMVGGEGWVVPDHGDMVRLTFATEAVRVLIAELLVLDGIHRVTAETLVGHRVNGGPGCRPRPRR